MDLLQSGHTVALPLGGACMAPVLRPGDTIVVHAASVDDVNAGDVVLVDIGERLFCHRLLYKTRSFLVTRGDGAAERDPRLPHSALLGRVEVQPSPRALYAALRALARP